MQLPFGDLCLLSVPFSLKTTKKILRDEALNLFAKFLLNALC